MKRLGKIRSFAVISIYLCALACWVGSAHASNSSSVQRVTSKIAHNSSEFRALRKVGIGLSAAGAQGVVGSTIELNFTSEVSLATHFGLGDSYQSFGLSLKRIIAGRSFAPYISGGFARWYTVREGGPINNSTPGFLADRFLTEKQKAEGKFSRTMIYPALGIQYLQLDGSWAGMSFFAEVLMLLDIDDFHSAATGGMGMMYYF